MPAEDFKTQPQTRGLIPLQPLQQQQQGQARVPQPPESSGTAAFPAHLAAPVHPRPLMLKLLCGHNAKKSGHIARGLTDLNLALSNTLKTDLLSAAQPEGQWLEDHRVTGPFLGSPDLARLRPSVWQAPCYHREGWPGASLELEHTGISSTSAFSLRPECFIQAPSSPSWQREQCPTGTRHEPALLLQATSLRVKEVMGGGDKHG